MAVYLEGLDGASKAAEPSDAARTAVDGTFRIETAAASSARIRALQADYRQVVKTIEILPGEQRVDLVLPEGIEVSGQVVGPGGPVAGASVLLSGGGHGAGLARPGAHRPRGGPSSSVA